MQSSSIRCVALNLNPASTHIHGDKLLWCDIFCGTHL